MEETKGDLRLLEEYFASKVERIKQLIALRGATDSAECRDELRQIADELAENHQILDELEAQNARRKESLKKLAALVEMTNDFETQLSHMNTHLPTHLPGFQQPIKPKQKIYTTPSKLPIPVGSPPQRHRTKPPPPKEELKRKTSKKSLTIPKIPYLTINEFDSIPTYIKKRMTYEQVNTGVDELHRILEEKYKIMSMPRSKLGTQAMKRFEAFRNAENDDTTGQHFFTDDDIRQMGQKLKLDSNGKSILTMLRHCGRLKESRRGGINRYIIIVSG